MTFRSLGFFRRKTNWTQETLSKKDKKRKKQATHVGFLDFTVHDHFASVDVKLLHVLGNMLPACVEFPAHL